MSVLFVISRGVGILLGLVGVASIVGRDIRVSSTAGSIDLNGLLLVKVTTLTGDLLLFLLLLLIASVRVSGLLDGLRCVLIATTQVFIIVKLDLGSSGLLLNGLLIGIIGSLVCVFLSPIVRLISIVVLLGLPGVVLLLLIGHKARLEARAGRGLLLV